MRKDIILWLKRSEVVVGQTFLATEAYRLFPGLMQWVMNQNVN